MREAQRFVLESVHQDDTDARECIVVELADRLARQMTRTDHAETEGDDLARSATEASCFGGWNAGENEGTLPPQRAPPTPIAFDASGAREADSRIRETRVTPRSSRSSRRPLSNAPTFDRHERQVLRALLPQRHRAFHFIDEGDVEQLAHRPVEPDPFDDRS
jgi:hypothetical protein